MNSVKRDFFSGIYYSTISKYGGIVINLLVSAILSRLLQPEEFGIVAISLVFISFFSMVTDIGIGPAIVQNKDLTKDDINHIFTITIYAAAVLSGIFALSAHAIAKYYNTEILENICKILSVCLFFSIANIVPKSILLKNKEFRFIGLRTIAIQFFSGLLAVGAAFKAFGIYSLLVTPILTAVLSFIVNFYANPLIFKLHITFEGFKKIYSFSAYQFLFTVINYFSRNLDNLMVGKYLGLNSLGYYEKSYRLMMLPLSNISFVLTPVMHPILSNYQNNIPHLTSIYKKIFRFLSFVALPLSSYLFFTSKELILLIFGEQWGQSIPIFRVLSVSVGFQIIVASAGAIFQATNNTKLLFVDGTLSTMVTVTCILLGVFVYRDLVILAALISGSYILNFFKSFYILFKWGLKTGLCQFYKLLLFPAGVAIVLAFLLHGLDLILNYDLWIMLTIKSFIAGGLGIISSFISKDYNFINYIKDGFK